MRVGLDIGSDTVKAVLLDEEGAITELPTLRIQGQPLARVRDQLVAVRERGVTSALVGATGSGAASFGALIGVSPIEEISALSTALGIIDPEVRTIIEMGRESQKYILLKETGREGDLLVEEVSLGHKCAAGTGSFLDHMHRRLNYDSIDQFAETALETDNPATLSGRCGVFTESDIVHLYQKGTPRERIVAGIHQAICRTYRNSVLKGRPVVGKVAFVGGVSQNAGARKYLAQELNVDGRLVVPPHNVTAGAIGAAAEATAELNIDQVVAALEDHLEKPLEYHATEPLRFERSSYHEPPVVADLPKKVALAGLGVDIGSVSTKAAVITEVDGKVLVLAAYYRRTEGDPLSAVKDTLGHINGQLRERGIEIEKIVAGTTGSGRYLTADYIGADAVKNEITAQAHGTIAFAPEVDTIFEIGGQDSKYIKLSGPVIVDFEMNKACAAGTGAFLEKQAQNLGISIEEFGDVALRGTAPPELDWQCTVFSESAMLYYQRNNIPNEDLAAAVCIASVKNYLNKNVAGREIGERVAFQGAVAFNKGMVAAMETVLGKPIIVPPYHHLTGAAGVAWLAYREAPKESSFVGFDTIAQAEYTVSSFECKACENRCDVNTFRLGDGPTFFYNDRCERYSAERKVKKGEGLPDLFAEYEALLTRPVGPEPPQGAPRVGVPRGLMFCDYFPLWNGFLRTLGFEVVLSDETSTRIVQRGKELSAAEPCFPMKVAHGHVADVLERDVDFLFYPAVYDTGEPEGDWRHTRTCPYVQGAPEVIGAALGLGTSGQVRYITPRLNFQRGEAHVRRVLRETAEEMGKSRGDADSAIDIGLQALRDFRDAIDARGAEIVSGLPEEQMAFVVIGRPYTLYDSAVNMQVGQRIRDLGILPIPQDFLPLASEDPSPEWVNAYSRQVQKKLQAARIVRHDPRLRAIVLTYFGCGPDSFANPFVKEELGEPCYVMQIDEHTADAGVITRMEAFADTAAAITVSERERPIRTSTTSMAELAQRGTRVWIPDLEGSAHVMAAAFRAFGVNAAVLPRSPDPGLNLARKAISEDVCLPSLVTAEDMLWRTVQKDFDPAREAFFQGSSAGPCRYGMYSMLQRRILDHKGLHETEMVSLGLASLHGGLGPAPVVLTFQGVLAYDMIQKMLHRTRPYEIEEGACQALHDKYLAEIVEVMTPQGERLKTRGGMLMAYLGLGIEEYVDLIKRAQAEFAAVPRRDEDRPLVGVVGEFYVRLHPDSNQHVIRRLERAGAEVWLAPLTEFFMYSIYLTGWLAEDAMRDSSFWPNARGAVFCRFLSGLAAKLEHAMFQATLPYLEGYDDVPPKEVVELGSDYVNRRFGGEAICSMGKAEDFARRGVDGIVAVAPFNCMPGMTVTATSQTLRERHDGIPFLCLEYDGFEDATRDTKIRTFVRQMADARAARRTSEAS